MRIIFVVLGASTGEAKQARRPACPVIPVNSDNSAPKKPLDRRQNLQLPTPDPGKSGLPSSYHVGGKTQLQGEDTDEERSGSLSGISIEGLREAINMHQLMLG